MRNVFFLFVACLFLFPQDNKAQTGQFISADRFSNSLINDLCQDSQGSIWIATDYGLNRYDGYQFQTFLHQDSDTTSLSDNMAVSLLTDKDGKVFVGTSRGLDCFDTSTETFRHYTFPNNIRPRVSALLQTTDGTILLGTAGYGAFSIAHDGRLQPYFPDDDSHYFSRLFEDSNGRLWHSGFDDNISMHTPDGKSRLFHSTVGNPQAFVEQQGEVLAICLHGIMAYDGQTMRQASIDMSALHGKDVVFWKATTAKDGTIYVGTRGRGLYRIAPGSSRRIEYVDVTTHGLDLNTAKVSATLFDRKGNLWLACQRKGLVMMPLRPTAFKNWSFESQGIRLGSNISSVCEGDGGLVWATVQGVGVYGFNKKGRVVAHPQSPDAVEFIFRDKQRRYWVGTDDALFSYDPLTGRYDQLVTFDCDKFNDMTSDSLGNIYISTFSRGFCVYNTNTGTLHNFNMTASGDSVRGYLCNNWILAMMPDHHGRLWLATSSGVSCYDPKADTFKVFGWNELLQGVICYSLCETSRGHILIGTSQGLYIYEPGKPEATLFPESEALADKVVNYIVEANGGELWCSTSMGLWQYDINEKVFKGYVAGNGLEKKEYVLNVGLHTDDDRIYFGHNDGLTVFSPSEFQRDTLTLDMPQLTSFRAGHQYVVSQTELNGIKVTNGKPVADCNYFTLSYLDHTIALSFSMFNFESAQNVRMEYRLNNDSWISGSEGQNEFTFGHLQPGTYRIEVRASLGASYSPSKVVIITIRAPWYRTAWAYLIYILLFLAIVSLLAYLWRKRANRQLEEDKMKFLINATHDIRSPLTIILAALKKLEKVPAVDTIEHNSLRILNLVNQILDVRKIDKQQMHLHCEETDMVSFVAGICKMFEFGAQERGMHFEFCHEGLESLPAWVDRSQFDKVVTNLLSNAFKYSPDGGEIIVSLAVGANLGANASERLNSGIPKLGNGVGSYNERLGFLVLKVTDNGEGLDPETLHHIFERFYQGRNSRKLNIEGTGIGLNLCKMIVTMHHGTIDATNRTDGQQGSVFTVRLPLGNAHLKAEEMDKPTITAATDSPATTNATAPGGSTTGTGTTRRRVLLVDDDDEIGHYIQQELGRYYRFTLCPNGKEGLKELLTGGDYDCVVSDVMMPEMDGFTMLRMIKTNLNVAHLPVIMLTSKADVANRLEGLERGADAFLAKPFDMEELHLTIDNLIQGRQRLKGKFTGAQQQADKLEQPEVKGNDEQLMERIMKAVNKNLADSDFNVEMLCSEVGISRAQLHRKMKELTGLSTSEFIRNIRLEQAARLLKEQKINVTQVAYTVGFSNLAHFSTIFRKHFGVTPSEYAANQ